MHRSKEKVNNYTFIEEKHFSFFLYTKDIYFTSYYIDTTLLQCLSAKNTDRNEFTNFPTQFFFSVPDCPCSLFQAASDFRYFQVFSVFPRFCYSFVWNIGPTNLCCYSTNIL